MPNFDPDKPSPTYLKDLHEHYKSIHNRVGIKKVPVEALKIVEELKKVEPPPPPPKPKPIMTDEERLILQTEQYPAAGISMKEAIRKLSLAYDTDYETIVSPARFIEYVNIRANIIQALYIMFGPEVSLSRMGNLFNRDHTTILHMIKRYNIDIHAKIKEPYITKVRLIRRDSKRTELELRRTK